MPDVPARSWDFVGNVCPLSGVLDVALERAADEVARAEADRKSKRKNNSAEQNSKRQFDDISAYLQMVEHHGRRQNKNEPLHAQRKNPRILQLRVHGADQHRAGKKSRDHYACDQQQRGPDSMS